MKTNRVPSVRKAAAALSSDGDDRFVGRRDELTTFDARLDDALRRDGSVVLLSGVAGIGKTSVVHAWLESARARSFATAQVANFPFAREPYAPVAELCRTLARLDPRAVPRGEGRALFTRFLDLLPPGEAHDAEPWQKRRLFVLVREFLERVAVSTPLALAIDDAHWIDPESLELVHYLTPHLSDMRMVLALAMRRPEGVATEEDSFRAIERHPASYRIRLGPLASHETRELIFALVPAGRRLTRRTIDEIDKRCADSPLFAEELVRSALRDERALSLPLTVEQSVNDRLATLPAGDGALLEVASVFGSRIDADALVAIFAASPADTVRALRAARALDLVVDDDGSGGMHFGHEFIRAAIYARLTAPERRAHHARIAAYLRDRDPAPAPGDLHRHVLGAGDRPAAAVLAEHAGDDAMSRFAYASARAFFEAALDGGELGGAEEARVNEKLGTAHDLLGSPHEAAAAFERTMDYAAATGNRLRQAEMAIKLALAAGRMSDPQREAEQCQRALVLSDGDGATAFAAEVLLSLHYANRVDAERAAEHLARAGALAPVATSSFSVRHHVARAALANLGNDRAAWRAACFAAVEAAETFGDPALLANVWSYIADFARISGDSDLARRGFADAIDAADRYGLTFTAAKSRLAAADMAFAQGRVADAHRYVREAAALQVDGAYARMHVVAVGLPVALAADDAFLRERLDDREQLAAVPAGDVQPLAVSFIAAHVERLARSGDTARALELIARTLPRLRTAHFIDSALLTFARYGTPADAQTAAELLATTANRDDGIACVHIALAAAVAATQRGDVDAAAAHAREAQRYAVEAQTPLLEALAIELSGDHGKARDRYAACGSAGDVRRLGDETGAGRRANAELTRRETEVAAFIADGLSNRSIAERLVLSERTVEHHVSAIFAKLAFRSRAQLAAFISRPQRSR